MLRDAVDEAAEQGRTLREQLRYRERESAKLVAGGSVSSAGTGGNSSSFSPSGPGAMTAMETADAATALVEVHDLCRDALIAAGTATPTDTQIYDAMIVRDELTSVERFGTIRPDFSSPTYA